VHYWQRTEILKSDIFATFGPLWPWPWIGSYGIPLFITHRPLSTYRFRWNQKNFFWTDGRMDGHWDRFIRSNLGGVYLIKMDRNLILIYESGRISTVQPHLDPFTGSSFILLSFLKPFIIWLWVNRYLQLMSSSNSVSSFNIPTTACRFDSWRWLTNQSEALLVHSSPTSTFHKHTHNIHFWH